jgi:excisionase family DNA binding protein
VIDFLSGNSTEKEFTVADDVAVQVPKVAVRPETAARMLEVSRDKIYELIASGALPSFKIGGSRRIAVEDVHAYIQSLRAPCAA